LTGGETPEALDANTAVLDRLQHIRRTAAVATGIARDEAEARLSISVPAIGFAAPPMEAPRCEPQRRCRAMPSAATPGAVGGWK
jgi:2-methylaconitate cis-trans-isomerase PrpF